MVSGERLRVGVRGDRAPDGNRGQPPHNAVTGHTNVFGREHPAIATSEAQYGEMWAQDIVAMEGYAGASAAASQCRRSPPRSGPPAGRVAE